MCLMPRLKAVAENKIQENKLTVVRQINKLRQQRQHQIEIDAYTIAFNKLSVPKIFFNSIDY